MSENFTISGIVIEVGSTEKIGYGNLFKRQLVLGVMGQKLKTIPIEFKGGNTRYLDNINEGDFLNVVFSPDGWVLDKEGSPKRYFATLEGLMVDKLK